VISEKTGIVAEAWTLQGSYIINDRDMFLFAIGAMNMSSTKEDFVFWEFVSLGCSHLTCYVR